MNIELKVPPVIIGLIIAAGMWGIDQYVAVNWAMFGQSLWMSFIFFAVGGAFILPGVIAFYRHSTSIDPHKPDKASNLVSSGIYRISRNPMYIGMLCILAAYGFYLGNGLTLLLLPVFVGYMNRFQIKPEEKVMEEKFGEEYLHYKKEVRRWL